MARQLEQPSFFYLLHLTLFLAIAYMTVVNMAGLYIVSDLGGSSQISLYPMVFFGIGNLFSIPIASPLADRFGPIKLLSYSLLLYIFTSHLCAIAPTFFIFNFYRLLLGFSCGFFFVLCRRLMLALAPADKLKGYLFINILLFGVVPVLGASFGAWLSYEAHWRWIFYLNEPIAAILAIYFWIKAKSLDPAQGICKFDTIGYFFFCIGLGSLITAATLAQELDWHRSWIFLALLAIGVPFLLFFLLWSLFHSNPLLELRLLKSPLLLFSLLCVAVLFSSYFGMIILISLWLNIYANYTPIWIAILIGIMGGSALAAFLISRSFFRHFDPRVALGLSILFLASSCYYSTFFNVDVDFFHLAVARSLSGIGLILFLFPVFRLSFASYGPEKDTSIYILFQLTRVIFSCLGAGLYVILWQRRQAFFQERLGENITAASQLTRQYFETATHLFHLTKEQAQMQLAIYQEQYATSLALNDVFSFMGYILLGFFILLLLGLKYTKVTTSQVEKHAIEQDEASLG